MDDRTWDTMATHQALLTISDNPRQFRRDQMMALLDQTYRAAGGQDDGPSYMTMPF